MPMTINGYSSLLTPRSPRSLRQNDGVAHPAARPPRLGVVLPHSAAPLLPPLSGRATLLRPVRSDVYLGQYDSWIAPLVKRLTSKQFADRRIVVFDQMPLHSIRFTGKEIACLLQALRFSIPAIAALPPEKRKEHVIEAVVDTHQGQKVIRVRAGAIPAYLDRVYKAAGFRGLPARVEGLNLKGQFQLLDNAEMKGILVQEKTHLEALAEECRSWFIDSGNPDKGKKYSYSLYFTRAALDEKFPAWKKLLPKLLKEAPHSEFAQSAYFALNALKENAFSDEKIRVQGAFILNHIRRALASIKTARLDNDEQKQILQMILHFCYAKMTGVKMYPFFEDFIPKVLHAAQPGKEAELPHLTFENLADEIKMANERLGMAPPEYRQTLVAKEFKKLKGTIGYAFDSLADSNVPWVHSVQNAMTSQGERSCTVLRHGTPTCDPHLLGAFARTFQNITGRGPFACIDPEYRAFLGAAPHQNTLYCNAQEHDEENSRWLVGPEMDRSRALRQLEKDCSNFFFMALPMDGYFWDDKFLENINGSDLKKELFASFTQSKNGFGYPKTIDIRQHAGKIEEILNQVHELYFPNGFDNLALKKAFILLFYSEVKDYFKNIIKVDFVVTACRDGKDRGNVCTTVDMVKNMVKLGLENEPTGLLQLFILVLATFTIKNELIIRERLEMALHVIRHLASLNETQKKKIRETPSASGYHIRRQAVPRDPVSWAQMVGPESFMASIANMRKLKETRIVIDPQFQANVVSSFYSPKTGWKLGALRQQLEKDLNKRMDIRLNGTRIFDFGLLCQELRLAEVFAKNKVPNKEEQRALEFMCLLQQGAAAETIRDSAHYLGGNAVGLVVAPQEQPASSEANANAHDLPRIYGQYEFDKNLREVRIEQDMELCDPASRDPSIRDRANKIRLPFRIKGVIKGDRPAQISWFFI